MFDLKEWFNSRLEELDEYVYIDAVEHRYMMNRLGLIIDLKFNRHIYPYLYGNVYYCVLRLSGKPVKMNWYKLFLMTHSPMHTSIDVYKNILNVHIRDESVIGPDLKNLIWKIPPSGIQCDLLPGYYSIPGNQDVVVSKDGNFLSYPEGKRLNVYYPKKDNYYPSLTINFPAKGFYNQRTAAVHRLVALAFIPVKGNKKYFYVNHIDGNKRNFKIENLEWCSSYENNDHAIRTGLRKDIVRIKLYNVKTKEIRHFPSAGKASAFLGIVKGSMLTSIAQWKKFQFVKYAPWIVFRENEKIGDISEDVLNNVSYSVSLIYKLKKDGVVNYYYMYSSIPKETGITRKVLSKYPKMLDHVFIKGYCVTTYTKENLPKNAVVDTTFHKVGGSKPNRISVQDLNTDEVKEYNSSLEFANILGVKKKTMQKLAWNNNGIYRNYKITYLN